MTAHKAGLGESPRLLDYIKPAQLRCCTRAEYEHWAHGGDYVAGILKTRADAFCRESVRTWCVERRADHKCVRTEREWGLLMTHDETEVRQDREAMEADAVRMATRDAGTYIPRTAERARRVHKRLPAGEGG